MNYGCSDKGFAQTAGQKYVMVRLIKTGTAGQPLVERAAEIDRVNEVSYEIGATAWFPVSNIVVSASVAASANPSFAFRGRKVWVLPLHLSKGYRY